MNEPIQLSIVVPCYNEQAVLPALYQRLTAVCDQLNVSSEIILVNDGSRDATWPMIRDYAQTDGRVVGVNLSRNHGHQIALTAGLSVSRGRRILVLDADLQDPPELLPRMWKLMDDGADVVYGQRVRRHGETAMKRWTAALFYRLLNRLTECDIPADTGDFRLMNRRVLDSFLAMPERHRFVRGMVSWLGFVQVPFHYERQPRLAGESHYPIRRMVRLAWDAVVGFSTKPLTLPLWLSAYTSIAGIGFGIAAIWVGSASLGIAALICLLGALQFLCLGIMGQYLGRIHSQSQDRPLYTIESVVRKESATVALRRPA